MRFGPENKDLCHHAEQLLGIMVQLFQPAGSEKKHTKTHHIVIKNCSYKTKPMPELAESLLSVMHLPIFVSYN